MRITIPCAALMAVSLSSLSAADLDLCDLRFDAGVLSHDFKGGSNTTINTGTGTTTTDSGDSGRNADENYRAQIQYVGGHLGFGGGLIYGAGIAVNRATWEDGAQDAHVTTPTVDVLLGYGYAVTPNWHFELAPFAGIGRAYYSVTDNGSTTRTNEWDKYLEFGARLGTYFALGGLVVGVEVPYLIGKFNPSYNYSNGSNEVSVTDNRKNQGLGLLLSVGARF
jgi:hypothetical protein